MKAVTAGERLYLLVRDEVLDLTGQGSVQWANISTLVQSLSGGESFASYVKGASAIHATRRLLRYWKDERPHIPNESAHVRNVTNFIREEVFPSIAQELSGRIARAVIAAERASNRTISPGARAIVLNEKLRHTCYLCGCRLDSEAQEDSEEFLTLEHLWPTSIGGDSIVENLIPACHRCQHHTQDAMSWEWINIHNVMLPASPSEDALRSVPHRVRYARHYFEALRATEAQHLTLKEAFVRLGPLVTPLRYVSTGLPITFFDLQTA